jgi:hypothetical protein
MTAGYTNGVQPVCGTTSGSTGKGAEIGGVGAVSGTSQTSCRSGQVGKGLYGRAGYWIDAFGLQCAAPGIATNNANIVGDSGGSAQGPFDCPAGYALIGVQASFAIYDSHTGEEVFASLSGVCSKYTAGTLGSVPPRALRYKGRDPRGEVSFRLLARHTSVFGVAARWSYTLYDLSFATSCSSDSGKVPDQVTVNGRNNASTKSRFRLRTRMYLLTGRISGTLARPTVSGTVRLLRGACRGETFSFTAKP